MLRRYLFAAPLLVLGMSSANGQCSATTSSASQPFVPPEPYRTVAYRGFWFGSPSLWTAIKPGEYQVGTNQRLSAKLVYWKVGYDSRQEPNPDLQVVARPTGRR
jgi:hypothetical protein